MRKLIGLITASIFGIAVGWVFTLGAINILDRIFPDPHVTFGCPCPCHKPLTTP